MNADDKQDVLTLDLLSIVHKDRSVSQRNLADRLGVALGVANAYIKKCVQKGLIKIEAAPANRYFYYLTRKGFLEKSRLTKQYMVSLFNTYRVARASISTLLEQCIERGYSRVVLFGVSELSELAILWSDQLGIDVALVFDPEFPGRQFFRRTVKKEILSIPLNAVIILTCLSDIDYFLGLAKRFSPPEKILVPDVLSKLH